MTRPGHHGPIHHTLGHTMRSIVLATLLAFLGIFSAPAAAADKDVGIVLMHGKWAPGPGIMLGLARQLEAQGFQVATPTMPWSRGRDYDVPYPQALDEISSAVQELRGKGAQHIVIGGLSTGANAALAYAASGKPVDALILLSPGHTPYAGKMRTTLESSVAKAAEMIKSGAGRERAAFMDVNQGRSKQVSTSAESYFSYFDPEGLAAMPKTAAAIPVAMPIFMAVGSSDRMSSFAEATIFARAPKHPKSAFTVVSADHVSVATVIAPALIAWLQSLAY
jgi:acetyl esterase/lipase